jgi:hypothetical protein
MLRASDEFVPVRPLQVRKPSPGARFDEAVCFPINGEHELQEDP